MTNMILTKSKMIRAAVIGFVLAVLGRLLVSAGAIFPGRMLYSDPAHVLFRTISTLQIHLPPHFGGILGLIWTTLFWGLFAWLIGRLMR